MSWRTWSLYEMIFKKNNRTYNILSFVRLFILSSFRTKISFWCFMKQYMNDFLQCLIFSKIRNSFERRNLHVNQVRWIFVQICFQKKNDFVDVNIIFENNNRRINNSRIHDNDNDCVVDEIKIFHDVRWIDFCEIVWNFFDLFIDNLKFVVNHLIIHLFNKQKIMFNFENISDDQMQIRENFRRITLIQYFDINRKTKRTLNVDRSFSWTFKHLNIFKKFWIIYIKK